MAVVSQILILLPENKLARRGEFVQGQRSGQSADSRIELFAESCSSWKLRIFPRLGLVDEAEKGCDNCWLCDALNVCLRAAASR